MSEQFIIASVIAVLAFIAGWLAHRWALADSVKRIVREVDKCVEILNQTRDVRLGKGGENVAKGTSGD